MKKIITRGESTSKPTIITNWRAERPMVIKEPIVREYDQCGARYYETASGKIFDADIYDKLFNITSQGPILPQNPKKKPQGKNQYRSGKVKLVNTKHKKAC